ncbi:DUF2894 domain-containing protein [Variovorax sp. J22R24]|uniref:DUF2894 domain-containing protein n=1 Tax=Variovorax gracilis TaxID=3053502 RepID=UPI0025749319|nr:DUF2894 domain-containing protein [Variovorax sp. J22R24]MDM0104045.1 DUF2894 domain-containing protein [Variovorax sp. J22R24]
MSSEEAIDTVAMIESRRRRGDHRLDPVRFRFIEALAKRSATYGGDARRILDDRVAQLLAAYAEDLEKTPCADGSIMKHSGKVPRHRGALGALVDQMGQHASPLGDAPGARDELKTLTQFRSTWSRLSADRRLTQSEATVPQNAGPLNSHHLVHRSLRLMRDVSPEYLSRFMSYVDALLGLNQLHSGGGSGGANAPRVEKKAARGKSA